MSLKNLIISDAENILFNVDEFSFTADYVYKSGAAASTGILVNICEKDDEEAEYAEIEFLISAVTAVPIVNDEIQITGGSTWYVEKRINTIGGRYVVRAYKNRKHT